jgi:hypothetical protein
MTMIADARATVAARPRECVDAFTGRPKVGFATRREASHVRRVKRVLDQHPYLCSSCLFWHLGHRS